MKRPDEERASRDRSLAAETLEGDEVGGGRDAPCGDDRQADGQHLGEQVEVRPGERAVPRRRRHEQPGHTGLRAAACQLGRAHVRDTRPSVDGDPAVPHVDGDDESVAEPRDRCLDEPGGERRRPDHHAIRPRIQGGGRPPRASGSRPRPGAADRQRRDTRVDEIERGGTRERAVEVDEMEPCRAFRGEAARELDGVAALDRDRLAPSLREPNDSPLEHVDGGDDFELAC